VATSGVQLTEAAASGDTYGDRVGAIAVQAAVSGANGWGESQSAVRTAV
jgi:hypothetical protein